MQAVENQVSAAKNCGKREDAKMEFRTDVLLHGGDYNPDQWLDRPDILERDAEMLAESGCNVVSLGIFAWSTLEPEEGVFRLD